MYNLYIRALFYVACLTILNCVRAQQQVPISVSVPNVLEDDDLKVPVVLAVMSHCSDAYMCESVFDNVLKEKGVLDKINLSLTMLALYVSRDFNVSIVQGPTRSNSFLAKPNRIRVMVSGVRTVCWNARATSNTCAR